MTTAPPQLLAARRLLLDHLDMHPGRTVGADLDPAEVGIVGDPAHVGGYHCGADRVRRVDGVIRDYSVTESPRDRAGLGEFASALDIGWFDVTVAGRRWTLYAFNAWLVAECQRGAPDTADIREVIYTPDGQTVRRWDRLGRRTTGDDSHRWHTHISEHRDARGRRMPALMGRWLTHIGLIHPQEDIMPALSDDEQEELLRLARRINQVLEDGLRPEGNQTSGGVPINWLVRTLGEIQRDRPSVDPADLAALVDPLAARITAALPAGGVTAAQVRAAVAEVLRGGVDQVPAS